MNSFPADWVNQIYNQMNNITSKIHIYYIDFEYSQQEAAVGGNQLFTMSQML